MAYKKVEIDKRCVYTKEFKQEIYRLHTVEEMQISDIAKKFDMPITTVIAIIESAELRRPTQKWHEKYKLFLKKIEGNAQMKNKADATFKSLQPGNNIIILAKGRKKTD